MTYEIQTAEPPQPSGFFTSRRRKYLALIEAAARLVAPGQWFHESTGIKLPRVSWALTAARRRGEISRCIGCYTSTDGRVIVRHFDAPVASSRTRRPRTEPPGKPAESVTPSAASPTGGGLLPSGRLPAAELKRIAEGAAKPSYERSSVAESIKSARSAGAEPGTVFVPKAPAPAATGVPQPDHRSGGKHGRATPIPPRGE